MIVDSCLSIKNEDNKSVRNWTRRSRVHTVIKSNKYPEIYTLLQISNVHCCFPHQFLHLDNANWSLVCFITVSL